MKYQNDNSWTLVLMIVVCRDFIKLVFAEDHQMTEEEQQAYYAKREQELLDACRIKTKEQFLDECKEYS